MLSPLLIILLNCHPIHNRLRFLPLFQPWDLIYRSCQKQTQPCWSKFEVSKVQHGYETHSSFLSLCRSWNPASHKDYVRKDSTPELPLDNVQSLKVTGTTRTQSCAWQSIPWPIKVGRVGGGEREKCILNILLFCTRSELSTYLMETISMGLAHLPFSNL